MGGVVTVAVGVLAVRPARAHLPRFPRVDGRGRISRRRAAVWRCRYVAPESRQPTRESRLRLIRTKELIEFSNHLCPPFVRVWPSKFRHRDSSAEKAGVSGGIAG